MENHVNARKAPTMFGVQEDTEAQKEKDTQRKSDDDDYDGRELTTLDCRLHFVIPDISHEEQNAIIDAMDRLTDAVEDTASGLVREMSITASSTICSSKFPTKRIKRVRDDHDDKKTV